MMAPMAALLIVPMASSSINAITGKKAMRARKEQKSGFLPLLALLQGLNKDTITWIVWIKIFSSAPSF